MPHQEEETHTAQGFTGSLLACRTSPLICFHSTLIIVGLRVPTAPRSKLQLHISSCQIYSISSSCSSLFHEAERETALSVDKLLVKHLDRL